jgi:multidrug efflux pump subunit AcrB
MVWGMWIVRLALRRPYSVAVMAILIFIVGILSIKSMLVDIFPVIDIPVVAVVWSYTGLPAEDMERRVVLIHERAMSTTVSGIEKIESESIPGIGLLRIYFQPGTDIGSAIAQIAAVSSTVLRILPPGITPPNVVQFNASNVPVIQLTLTSDTLPEEKIFDYALNFIRIKLFTIPGLSTPAPYGGKSRQINVDVDPPRLNSKGLSPQDVVNALQASNLILPAGTARIGNLEYNVVLNSSPYTVEQFNQLPIKVVNHEPITIGDVAKVSDAFADQTNIVRVNGKRASYLNILRKANASTLDVVNALKSKIDGIQAQAPKGLKLKADFDQSVFVSDAISSVLREGLISSLLVALMILVFLGSWRSVIIVCTSIPLAILTSIIGLKLTGNSINIMTLGGLSLAIGMLVDDATVEIENINRNRGLGTPLTPAILTGASQIALPAIMATLSICVVFYPVGLLTGPAKYLFVPMALSVVFAMLASYVLSRTLVPLLSRMMLGSEKVPEGEHDNPLFPKLGLAFERLQESYSEVLTLLLEHRAFVGWFAVGLLLITLGLTFVVKKDFFPVTDTGLMKLHFRAPTGTRIELTETMVARAEESIKKIIPVEELETIDSMIGVPTSYNLAFISTDNIGGMDAEITVALKKSHRPTEEYMKKIRTRLTNEFPGAILYFQPADIISQVLNFGVTSPIDVEVTGPDLNEMVKVGKKLVDGIKTVPGAVDVNIKQVLDYPTLRLNVDRVRASQIGISQRDVASSMLIALSSSSLVSPSYFLNPDNNVNYIVAVKVPLQNMSSVGDLLSIPITPPSAGNILQNDARAASTVAGAMAETTTGTLPTSSTERLGNMASVKTTEVINEMNHENVQRVIDVTANVQDLDLGSVVDGIQKKIDALGKLPVGLEVKIQGQGVTMNESFAKLSAGIVLAMVLVYLLMVILFQSWLDPFIVMVAVPGALVGILWMLALTGTSINVESLMGAIMAVGIAASNSILLVSFANDKRVEDESLTPAEAALEAGRTRLRPVLMTALAMILGMLPAAIGAGEGGEQNAPLGRAVIGGLLVATFVTLFMVPLVYSVLRKDLPTKHQLDKKFEEEAGEGENSSGAREYVHG